jgi:hypothetical protein
MTKSGNKKNEVRGFIGRGYYTNYILLAIQFGGYEGVF